MTNTLYKIDSLFISGPKENKEKAIRIMKEYGHEIESFEAGEMPFNKLPRETQKEVRETLKTSYTAIVTFHNWEFEVSSSSCCRSDYPKDYFGCGIYREKDIK